MDDVGHFIGIQDLMFSLLFFVVVKLLTESCFKSFTSVFVTFMSNVLLIKGRHPASISFKKANYLLYCM
jgi:hypothetical protein